VRIVIADIGTGRIPNPGLSDGNRVLEIVEQVYRSSGYPAGL
jgi:hypothetical protein